MNEARGMMIDVNTSITKGAALTRIPFRGRSQKSGPGALPFAGQRSRVGQLRSSPRKGRGQKLGDVAAAKLSHAKRTPE